MSPLMKYSTILFILNILLCSIILIDTYMPFNHDVKDKCIKKEVILNRSRARLWASRQITTSKNMIFTLPEDVYDAIAVNDSFLIRRSSFLGAAKGIIYNDKEEVYYIRLAPIYGSLAGLIFNLAPLLTSLVLLYFTVIEKRKIELRHSIALFVISLLIVYTYLVSQS